MSFDCKMVMLATVVSLCLVPVGVARQQSPTETGSPDSKPTPRLANGDPDLNGTWDATSGHVRSSADHPPAEKLQDGSIVVLYNRTPGYGHPRPASAAPPKPSPYLPSYKPELLAKVHDLDVHQSQVDPSFACKPPGVPRIGPPQKIIQNKREVVFIYSDLNGNYWRIIPTDGRGHNADADPSYLGDSIGHFEGDTLVVDDTNFNDDTWLGKNGLFHSTALHVTERVTRHGDSLLYEATAEDPKVLTEPWKLRPQTLSISDTPLEEAPPCDDRDQSHFVNLDHD